MGRSKLKLALAAEKGIDAKKVTKLREKKKHKERVKLKQKKSGNHGGAIESEASSEDDNEEQDEEVNGGAPLAQDAGDDSGSEDEDEDEDIEEPDLAALDDSDDSDSSIEFEKKIERPRKAKGSMVETKKQIVDDEKEDEDEEEDEEDIDVEDLDDADLQDDERAELRAVTRKRTTINNTSALLASLNRISIPTDKSVPFATHQTIAGAEPTAAGLEDAEDDLKRELAFYAQSLDAAKRARSLLKAEGVPFSRPTDYFAEMVKDDGHMERIKAKLVEEASAKKASAEARKQRDLKKFGKQVQVAKLQERAKAKRDTLDKIKTLKRKRQESGGAELGTHEADLFDVGVDNELDKYAGKPGSKGPRGAGAGGANHKRQKKDAKYGFGGKKRHAKSGDAVSSADMSGFSARRMKTGAKGKLPKTSRLGKSRRNAGAGKR
ncbi:eukaryotic rRNA processing protein EBP2-domain-containing protein [Xylariaceae sp. FL0016]|nr:eukaryotic rRNA processing protein EBP2-domain-containing protein [Xylariaceae sp. FL0016]